MRAFDVYGEDEESLLFDGSQQRDKAWKRHMYLSQFTRRKALLIAVGVATGLVLLALVIGLALGVHARRREQHLALSSTGYQCPAGWDADAQDLNFFVIGDWGREGNSHQLLAAKMMAEVGACFRPAFVISTGDNFYDHGMKSNTDPTFLKSFTNVYTAPSLQVPWYAVLGNHDYGELPQSLLRTCSAKTLEACPAGCCYSPLWQLNMTHVDRRWHLQQSAWKLSFLDGALDLFFIDTTPLVPKYYKHDWKDTPGGLSSQDTEGQKAAIQGMLKNSTARWRLMVGHHPVRSYGEHCDFDGSGDCKALQFLRPWLAEHNVAAYFCGHEHDMQLIKAKDGKAEPDPVYYVVSGAGSDIRKGEFDHASKLMDAAFLADENGFVAASLKGDTLVLHLYVQSSLTPAYSVRINRPGA